MKNGKSDMTDNADGKTYWRSLNQLAQTDEFKQSLHREFPEGASEMGNDWSRRSFLTLMGASIALAGLSGCRRPEEKIVPYVSQPEEVTPGNALSFATTMPFGTSSFGLVVRSNEGRPTYIEGNKLHPSSMGAANSFIQADILNMYDPDRSQRVTQNGAEKSWDDFVAFWREQFEGFSANQGEGLAVLCQPYASPTIARLHKEYKNKFPRATWTTYEPVSDESIFAGVELASGYAGRPVYDIAKAKVVLSLDSDFLRMDSEDVFCTRGFADGRRVSSREDEMNRLYAVESLMSVTGSMADHRLRMASSDVPGFAVAVAEKLGVDLGGSAGEFDTDAFDVDWLNAVVADLKSAGKNALVMAGRRQPAVVHALVYGINLALGSITYTVSYPRLSDTEYSKTSGLSELVKAMKSGGVSTLVMISTNPVYNAPVDLDFAGALDKVTHTVHMGLHSDETGRKSEWHLPMAHFLESWGDALAVDGTPSSVQPLIEPLFGAHSWVELLSLLATGLDTRGYEIVRATWQEKFRGGEFEAKWRKMLHDGVTDGKADPGLKVNRYSLKDVAAALSEYASTSRNTDGLELTLFAGNLYDGGYANNGWMQELPDPITKIAWDNAALVSPKTAEDNQLSNGDMVRLEVGGRSLELPVWIVPGHADNTVAVALGYGRDMNGRVADGVGFNSYRLRTTDLYDFGKGVKLSKTGRTYALSSTQDHSSMEGRPIVREATLEQYRKEAEFYPKAINHPPLVPLWDEHSYAEGYQWGMTIDLNACTGCGACSIACQSENNIPIVGKEQVGNGREMHWVRVDRYFAGDLNDPEVVHQPIPCQHCENAPCEQVCPVAATVHDAEGLNLMTYNRCIGTRYCSNNCPYKVRRFNFFNFTKDTPEIEKMSKNPEVTVRSRGVMEKCTYCVQRISKTKIEAKRDGRKVADGDIVTACQSVCPADAIVFGNINDPESRVSKLKQQDRNYAVLEELAIKPRTTYLAKLRNPNPELQTKKHGQSKPAEDSQ